MGREIKRVALDFDWPQGEVWEGYVNPFWAHRSECPACGGRGYAPQAKYLFGQWYGYAEFRPEMTGNAPLLPDNPDVVAFATRSIERMDVGFLLSFYGTTDRPIATLRECYRLIAMWNGQWMHHLDSDDVAALVKADRLWDFTRRPRTPEQAEGMTGYWMAESNGYAPSPEEVNRWSLQGMGHDSLNCSICVRAKCERLGYQVYCSTCDGEGDAWDTEEHKQLYETWQKTEPPAGEGWQLWETVSEGSPVSPVFVTDEALISWLIASEGYSPQSARAFVGQGWAPSLVGVAGIGVWDGITAAGIMEAKDREHGA